MQVSDEMYADMAKGMRFAAYQTFFSILSWARSSR